MPWLLPRRSLQPPRRHLPTRRTSAGRLTITCRCPRPSRLNRLRWLSRSSPSLRPPSRAAPNPDPPATIGRTLASPTSRQFVSRRGPHQRPPPRPLDLRRLSLHGRHPRRGPRPRRRTGRHRLLPHRFHPCRLAPRSRGLHRIGLPRTDRLSLVPRRLATSRRVVSAQGWIGRSIDRNAASALRARAWRSRARAAVGVGGVAAVADGTVVRTAK